MTACTTRALRRSRAACAAAVLALLGLSAVVSCVPAQAATTHGFLSSVTQAPPGTPLEEPGPVTVERSTGELFVADPGAGVVDVFSSTGTYLTQLGEGLEPVGVAVDESSGDVYVASGNAVAVFKLNGKGGYEPLSEWDGASVPTGAFGELRGVAVNNSNSPSAGDVYVVDSEDDAVDVFKPKPPGAEEAEEGAFLSTLRGGKLGEPNAIAVNASSGNVYVADSSKGLVDIYSPSGAFEGKLTGAGSPEGSFRGAEGEEGNLSAIAVEEGDLYVAEGERRVVSEFNASGEWIGWVTGTPAPFSEPDGVGVAPDGALYVADALAAQIDLFGTGVNVPDAQTNDASKVAKTSAVLNGVVDGDGKAAKYHFEWGATEAYGSVTAAASAGSGEEKIKAELTGLAPGHIYHFRLVTENENGANVGADREFSTLPAVEGVSTGPVQGLEATEATLTGSLSPNGTDAHYLFQWGPTTAYGRETERVNAGSGKETVAAEAHLSGLSPNTTYHYRLLATNSFGSTTGEDESFTTSGPPTITGEPADGITHEGATINAKIDPGELETTYHFEYGQSTSYGAEVPAGKLAPGGTFSPVSAALSSLQIGTVYHYRLVASNSAGTTYEPDQTFETVPPALIEDTSAVEVSSTAATFAAQVNPLGHTTTYYLQYGSQPCKTNPAACTDIPTSPEAIGSGETPQPVSQHIQGLTAATTYYYRLVAINSLGTAEGPEHTITTQPAPLPPFALADGRAWEMVSPPNKHGAPIEALTREGGLILAAEDGNSITYVANGSIVEEPEGNRDPEQQQDLSTRTPQGWTTHDIATPNNKAAGISPGKPPEYQYFTPDLSTAVVEPFGAEPPLAPEARQQTIYLRNNANGTYLPLVTEGNVPAGTEFASKVHFLAATPDLSHVVLRSEVALTSPPSGPGLYEWAAGDLEFVSLLPTGTAAASGELGFDGRVVAHAISSDGSRVIWTDKDENSGAGHLYLRDTITGQTIQLDAAQGASEPDTGSAEFQTAASDGSRVYFTDKQRLTADSTAEPGFPEKADLYECEIAEEAGRLACHLRDLTVDPEEGQHAAVQGFLLGAGEDGSSVYLVAQGVLATNENGNGEVAEYPKDNLYELHYEDGTWTTTFIAQFSNEDRPEWEGNKQDDTAFLTARVSPNGRYLAFMSAASPTGYDNVDANAEAKGARDEEVYLYDSDSRSLTCVSCNPTGARPHGVFDTVEAGEGIGLLVDRRKVWAESGHEHWLAGNIPGWTAQSLTNAQFQSRYLSNEGRLFFNSADALVPQVAVRTREEEAGGKKLSVGVENVYEYESSAVGSCESPTGGCVSLISGGTSDRESAFLEATPSGNDAFFLTAAQLLPQDTDTAFDIYDARVCTQESPCLTPPNPAPPGCSSTDACRPAEPSQQAPLGAGGTATVASPGNMIGAPATGGVKSSKKYKPKPITRAQKLASAMRSCRRQHPHSKKKRARCEAQARRKYGIQEKAKKTRKARKKSAIVHAMQRRKQ